MEVHITSLLLVILSLHGGECFNVARTYDYISNDGDQNIIPRNLDYKNLINYKDMFAPTAEKSHKLKGVKNSAEDILLISEHSDTERSPLTVLQALATFYSKKTSAIDDQEQRNALGGDYKADSYASFVNRAEDQQQTKSHFIDRFVDDVDDDGFVDNSNDPLFNRIFDWIKANRATDLNIKSDSDIQNEVSINKRGDKRPQRDVYSLLNEDFIKRHELGSEKDIKRLLEALATIRDFLDKEKAAERRKAAKLLNPLSQRTRNNKNNGPLKPAKQRTNQKQEKWLNDKPRPNHQQDSRYKHYQKNEKSHRASRKGEVEFAVRTSHNNVNKQVDNFYHPEFNPTGW